MTSAVNRQKEYLRHRVESASPAQLVCMLYETAIQSTEEALDALRSGDILKRGQAVNRATEVLFELQGSLRHDVQKEYSDNLASLYSYLQRQLSRAHAEKSEELFQEVSRLLQTLLEGWQGAVQNLASAAAEAAPKSKPSGEQQSSRFLGGAAAGEPNSRSWHL
ncbi:MAG TPA: flagellar export chaperone FliS [Bryobacteraceae bacterium]